MSIPLFGSVIQRLTLPTSPAMLLLLVLKVVYSLSSFSTLHLKSLFCVTLSHICEKMCIKKAVSKCIIKTCTQELCRNELKPHVFVIVGLCLRLVCKRPTGRIRPLHIDMSGCCTVACVCISGALSSPAVSCNDVLWWSAEREEASLASAMDLTTNLILPDSQGDGQTKV